MFEYFCFASKLKFKITWLEFPSWKFLLDFERSLNIFIKSFKNVVSLSKNKQKTDIYIKIFKFLKVFKD